MAGVLLFAVEKHQNRVEQNILNNQETKCIQKS